MNPEHCGPVLASGDIEGYAWEFRASIGEQGFANWFEVRHPTRGGGGAGATGGMLPRLRHFGPIGWSGTPGRVWWWDRHAYRRPTNVHGIVGDAVRRVVVECARSAPKEALLLDVGHPSARAFVAVLETGLRWTALVALDAAGHELQRYPRPPPVRRRRRVLPRRP